MEKKKAKFYRLGKYDLRKRVLILGIISLGWSEKHIEIEKEAGRLRIMDGDSLIKEYGCALGRGGSKVKSKEGDRLTPEGEYKIVRINKESGYHTFLHLSYPNAADIERGRQSGLINDSTYHVLKAAVEKERLPIQNTKLGGFVGIHGIRNGFGWLGRLHRVYDWTQGCIALTNEEIEEIAAQVELGTRVVIKK